MSETEEPQLQRDHPIETSLDSTAEAPSATSIGDGPLTATVSSESVSSSSSANPSLLEKQSQGNSLLSDFVDPDRTSTIGTPKDLPIPAEGPSAPIVKSDEHSAISSSSTQTNPRSLVEPNSSDPSPEAAGLHGEDESDPEQYFTPTATPPILASAAISRTMTEEEESELARLREERQSDSRRRNAFYGGHQEDERKKVGSDPKEQLTEPPSSSSGLASVIGIRCTAGKRSDKLRSKSKRISVAFADCQGRRPTMEDDFVFVGQFRSDPHLDLVGLFDGHRGSSASRYAARELPTVLDQYMKHSPNPRDALRQSFLELHKQMKADGIKSGTTAIVALLTAEKIYVANAGDSRAVLCRGGKAIRLTSDHRPDSPTEIERITKLGGDIQDVVTKDGKVISRVGGLLGVSRALGDFDLEPSVTPEPEVAEFVWGADEPDNEFIIIACDGLWECVPDQDAVDIARIQLATDAEAACKRLRDVSFARGGTDNITVCLVQLSAANDPVTDQIKTPTHNKARRTCNML